MNMKLSIAGFVVAAIVTAIGGLGYQKVSAACNLKELVSHDPPPELTLRTCTSGETTWTCDREYINVHIHDDCGSGASVMDCVDNGFALQTHMMEICGPTVGTCTETLNLPAEQTSHAKKKHVDCLP
jgi:hypothetical protein